MNNEEFSPDINIIYGENGSGKTTLCNILKSVSGIYEFEKNIPKEISIEIDGNEHFYPSDGAWNSSIDKDSIFIFDKEFVDKNVHLGHIRGRKQGEHEQESGKLIIEFDQKAIELKSKRDEQKELHDKQILTKNEFNDKYKEILSFKLTDQETSFFCKYKDKSKDELNEIKENFEKDIRNTQRDLDIKRDLQKRVTEIQSIDIIKLPSANPRLSGYEKYSSLFNYQIITKSITDEHEHIANIIERYQEFFKTGFEIRNEENDKCPFCQSKSVEREIEIVKKVFDELFDKKYEKSVDGFIKLKNELSKELGDLDLEINNFDVQEIMLFLKEMQSNFSLEEIYSTEDEKSLKKPTIQNILKLKNKIEKLEKPSIENIGDLYKNVNKEFQELQGFYRLLFEKINQKNTVLEQFKQNSTDKKLNTGILSGEEQLQLMVFEKEFIQSCKIENQIKKEEIEIEQTTIINDSKKTEEKYNKAKSAYEDYVSNHAYQDLLKQISSYFNDVFNLSFRLEIDTESRRIDITKDFPLAFKIIDSDDKERDFKDGLSEGEMQVLSLCFFFAFLNIQGSKDSKVVIFDDPITSLDNNNLYSLVNYIEKIMNQFSQTFIFTHHRLFFKFLEKRFHLKGNILNILRNKNEFGGSFICRSKNEKFIERLKGLEQHLLDISKGRVDIESIIIEYGQYLRYEVELFVKNKLLQWDKCNNFGNAIEGVKKNKTISDDALDKIKSIYSFCNWTTSHVDVGEDHGLDQLKQNISAFIPIIENFQSADNT